MVGETATMKWTIDPENNPIEMFQLYVEKPEQIRIALEGSTSYNTGYTSRLTVVRNKSGNYIIITATLTKLAYNDTNTYKLTVGVVYKVVSDTLLTSSINLDVKGL